MKMNNFKQIVINNFDIWSSVIKSKSSSGRGSSSKIELYGVKKLRELILDLAVRGLLVPQDPNDEPASELLKKIKVEKDKLIKEGKLKKEKPLAEIKEEEIPFKLPSGWEWVRLGHIGYNFGQKTPDREFTYIDVGSINKDLGYIESPVILSPKNAPSRARKIVEKGTVIYSTVRPYLLNIAVINENFDPEPIVSTAFAIIHPFKVINSQFIYYFLRSVIFIKYVESCQTGIAYPAINDKQFFSGLFPLPPLAEQHRIVAKVEELMNICDKLEKEQTDNINAHETLVQVCLEALTNTTDYDSFNFAWKRISDNFDNLFITEWSIDQLKQTILQLAVMGKLVQQDPNDEPASELLKKIKAEKDKLIKEGKLKEGQITKDSKQINYELSIPNSWKYTKGNDIFFITKLAGFEFTEYIKLKDIGEIPVIRAQNVKPLKLQLDNIKYIDRSISELLSRCALVKNCLLVTFIGAGIGDVAIFDKTERWHLAPNVAKMELFENCDNFISLKFINYFLVSKHGQKEIFKHLKSTAQPSISMGTIRDIDYPLPPLSEQHRIVAKVEELMNICDKLKENLKEAQEIQIKLTDAITHNALN